MSIHPQHAAQRPVPVLSGFGRLAASLAGSLLTTALVLGAAALLAVSYAIVALHVSTATVLTGSMRGTFDPGSVVITEPIPAASVRPGDVIVFTPPGHDAPYTHRVMTVTQHDGHPVITTKGDANPVADPWKAQLTTRTVPKVMGHIPYVGRWLLALRGRDLHTSLLALFGLVIAISGTRLLLGQNTHRNRSPAHPRHGTRTA